MNVARSTFMRKGYLLTALAVAVLLAASSGTAWAQTIAFSTSRGTLQEGATIAPNTEDPLTISITRSTSSGSFDADDGESDTDNDATFEDWAPGKGHVKIQAVEYDGSTSPATIPFTFKMRSGDSTEQTRVTIGEDFSFGAEAARSDGIATRIELTIEHDETGDNGDWNEETLVLKVLAAEGLILHLGENKVSYRTQEHTVKVVDNEPMPVLKFTPDSIQLAKDNMRTVTVAVGTGDGGTGKLDQDDMRSTLNGLGSGKNVVLSVVPESAVGDLIEITFADGLELASDGSGGFIVGTIGSLIGSDEANDGIDLNIKALDVSGFRDETISLTLTDDRREREQDLDGGGITASDPATVTILSGEQTPTVKFSKATLELDEGDSETVHLLADTNHGDQVRSVAVVVRGDALIELRQNGGITGGLVSFGGSANAELTIVSLSDPALEDGEEKTATVTITDADGANIGDPRALTVTVTGSTAVPVLPLVGQLILALLLTVGGARLYRRRQQ